MKERVPISSYAGFVAPPKIVDGRILNLRGVLGVENQDQVYYTGCFRGTVQLTSVPFWTRIIHINILNVCVTFLPCWLPGDLQSL